MNTDEIKENTEYLVQEYFQLQKIVEEYDSKALTIKAWSVTLSAAAIVAAYVEKVPMALIVGATSALVFWVIEALWKTNQNAFYNRIYQIEAFFRSDSNKCSPLQIAGHWSKAWHKGNKELKSFRVMMWPHVFLPHLVVFLGGLLLYVFFSPIEVS